MSRSSEREAIIARLVALLKEERLRKSLSLNQVATGSGLSHTMVMRVEKRERIPTIDTLLRMADALEVDLGRLLVEASEQVRPRGESQCG